MPVSPLTLNNWVKPVHYDLKLDIDPTSSNFKGDALYTVKANSTTFDSFKLHCQDLVIISPKIIDKTNTIDLKVNYDKENQMVIFQLKDPSTSNVILESMDFTLSFSYIGKINSVKTNNDSTFGVFKSNFMDQTTGRSDNYIIATHCQPSFARTIFPCIDEPNIKTTFQLTLITLSKFKAISNSSISSTEIIEKTKKTIFQFNKTPLMTTSIFSFAIGDLEFMKGETKLPVSNRTIPIRIYAIKDVSLATFALDTVQKYLPILESYFNYSYPLDKLDFVLLPFLTDMAMENLGMITIHMNHMLLPPNILADKSISQQVQQVLVHELVHQWMGNTISFDSWEYLWFNEAFATWLACALLQENDDLSNYWDSDDYQIQILGSAMLNDSSKNSKSIYDISHKNIDDKKNVTSKSSTQDFFDAHSYNKGIAILRSFERCTGSNNVKLGLQKVFADKFFIEQCVKPLDIWTHVGNTLKSKNISNFFYSWTKLAGIPIVSVKMDDSKVNLTQHRFSNDIIDEKSRNEIEDVPYHIPLLSLLKDGGSDEKNVLMTDRTLTLDDTPILLLNHNSQGYYYVSYESIESYELISQSILNNTITEIDLLKIFDDIHAFLNTTYYQKPIHIEGALKLLKVLASDKIDLSSLIYLKPICKGLEVLQTITNSELLSNISNRNKKFKTIMIDSIIMPLFQKLKFSLKSPLFTEEELMNQTKLQILAQLLSLGKNEKLIIEYCSIYFKHVLQGPKQSIPFDIVSSTYIVNSTHFTTLKNWKKLFDLIKNSKGIASHIIDIDSNDKNQITALQNMALESISFSLELELINKVLNFINNSIDLTGIETSLFGLTFNGKCHVLSKGKPEKNNKLVEEIVWDWYTKYYPIWVKKASRPGSQASQNTRKSLHNITMVVFQMYATHDSAIKSFIKTSEEAIYNDTINLESIWNNVETRLQPKRKTLENMKLACV
ncbi:hypothetical protein TBLA_0E03650 [Henningerozyma blattae CBS 6284]|uniref:Aminopeptidase n=1 Tax=Henningerozyma blattae (strain ATCC 34711 / CBS 6284 / DSM 70876 / NBRC 10599 / NRRL Y-10934 / UCD 77-7) TaxID=1071380 RepID=I2H4W7_HENB6|nr:hypothetical protein TBLA_0E03650 [Tetrapisispora blattae CBS 6284]CCH61419.1 hypothetical protein TBLA_0E03650 [Tetrapisispora blattae CBS 6284]